MVDPIPAAGNLVVDGRRPVPEVPPNPDVDGDAVQIRQSDREVREDGDQDAMDSAQMVPRLGRPAGQAVWNGEKEIVILIRLLVVEVPEGGEAGDVMEEHLEQVQGPHQREVLLPHSVKVQLGARLRTNDEEVPVCVRNT